MSDLDYLFERWNRLPAEQQREVFPRMLGRIESMLAHRGAINTAEFSRVFGEALHRAEAAVALPLPCEASVERWLESPAGQRCLARALRSIRRA